MLERKILCCGEHVLARGTRVGRSWEVSRKQSSGFFMISSCIEYPRCVLKRAKNRHLHFLFWCLSNFTSSFPPSLLTDRNDV